MSKKSLQFSWYHQRVLYVALATFAAFATTIILPSQLTAASCDDYNAVPPFLGAQLAPNVMFMLDNSGSMKNPLGQTTGYNCKNTDTAFDSDFTYYGMFDSTKTYSYDATIAVDPSPFSGAAGMPYNVAVDTTSTGAFKEDSTCTLGLGNNCWSGNFLNWIVTRRIDAARQVMIGGKVESRAGYNYFTDDPTDLEWKIVGNNERSDGSICKSYSSAQNYSPFPATSTFTVSSPAEDGTTQTLYDPYAKLSNKIPNIIVDENGTVIGEAGIISNLSADSGADNWETVALTKTDYANPVVLARPLSYNGSDPSVVRVDNVLTGSFKIRIEEWEYITNKAHTNEDISYIVLEAGSYTLENGQRLVAGTKTVNDAWTSVAALGYASKPVILSTVNTNNGGDTTTTRLKNINNDGSFEIQLQEEDAGGGHTNETVAYLALEQGTYDVGILNFEVGTETDVNHTWKEITFGTEKQGPIFLADMQTSNDTDPASIRYRSLGSDSVEIFIDEESSVDNDVTHSNEDVGYIIINPPPPTSFNIALIVEEEPTGLLHELEGDVRLGISFYRYQKDDDGETDIYNQEWAHGGTMSLDIPNNPFIKAPATYRTIDTPIKAPLADVVDAIEHYPLVWGTTPLAENYYEVLRYFQQDTPYYEDKPTIGTTYNYKVDDPDGATHLWDPYYFDEYEETIRCAKSFVLIFTDGEPYRDDYVPDFYDSTGNGTADTVDYDDDSNTDDCSDSGDTANGCQDILDDLAYWAYWDKDTSDFRDLRDDTGMTGNQHIETYTVAFGKATIPQILQDTADNGNGEAYAADDGHQLETALADAFSNILTKTAAGSSISVLSERATEGSIIHQALFFPEKSFIDDGTTRSLLWTGALNTYWFFNSGTVSNIREDNAVGTEFYLDTHDDHALDFRIDAEGSLNIDYYSLIDSQNDDDGKADALLGSYNSIDDVSRIWEGGYQLQKRDVATPDEWVAGSNGGRTIYGINESGTMSEFLADNYTLFKKNMRLDETQTDIPDCLGVAADETDPPDADKLEEIRSINLMSYIRGAADDFSGTSDKVTSSACRNRVVNDAGEIWKLGDIIYSTPQVVDNENFSIVLAAANDGMLHAFHAGKIRTDGLTTEQAVRLCDNNSDASCLQDEVGEELWAFIPQNAMPYLKYLTDPAYKHIYTTDMAPYRIKHGTKDIIIGGMRFGGAAGCTYESKDRWCGDPDDGTQVVAPGADPLTPESAVGLSSYFALDISDPRNPVFLWEFTHPNLGLTYSGPAYIKRGGNAYVMFTSGPLNYRAETNGDQGSVDAQNLNVFMLKVDSDFNLVDVDNDGDTDADDIFKFTGDSKKDGFITDSELGSYNSAFGGRLFTNGIDQDRDGNTDIVFFGVNDANGTAGTVIALVPKNAVDGDGNITSYDPTDKADVTAGTDETPNWYFDSVVESTDYPVTSKIVYGDCFNYPMIYFGTGRWFYKDDSPGVNQTKTEKLYGILIRDCLNDILAGKTCSLNYAHNNNDICQEVGNLDDEKTLGWVVDELEPKGDSYAKERTITDPTFANGTNIVFFTTMQPSSNPCDFGGRSRMWALNCMSGDSIWGGCDGYTTDYRDGSLLLQLSGGNIEGAGLNEDDFSEEGGKSTKWFTGIPPESPTPFIPPSPSLTGEIILWLEK
ncbi:hypothetical protein UWK_02281 [Desulfocapsa sulfexigens DSM 10523]|uniref:Tfp pilus assembly protein, tip-associated adhesin PilY1 n=1 Tax=Desulfocapsa sulfexigens (strain DSM 10523 / SB164P1) TaxID=1167006 RepID=M1PQZ9_DESSD|nr:hypothetical protein [Desulfocapsa sulfexigens]AGF78821.1 hypothetical protein UWK_02281 [Desulfocapsa sulfexigens DSM 10523]